MAEWVALMNFCKDNGLDPCAVRKIIEKALADGTR